VTDLFNTFYAFFASHWRVIADVFDVVIVAYVFYRGLLVIRGTRAMQMIVGLVLVFLVYQLAKRAHLVTLFTILDQLLTYVVLIVVVLFQNDIRRALMRVGRRPFFRAARSARESQVIEEVVKAATALAQKRIGALVVFERDAALDEFIEHGTRLDAAVSKELLYSIFVPSYENPMHDGAVVIREGRIWEAGVFLPLTDSQKVDRTLGTRHRAAIGISEETDAVVVVVSEERGTASICFSGNIVRDLDPTMLRQALIGLFEKPVKKARGKDKRRDATGRTSREVTGQHAPSRPPSITPPAPSSSEAEESA
jgi:diadenylate cyclase